MKPITARTTSPLSPRFLLLFALLFFCGFSQAWALPSCSPNSPAHTWQCWEHSLTSNSTYTNAYRDVVIKVTYTGQSGAAAGKVFSTYAFWEGGMAFKFRAAFPLTGVWNWATQCVANQDGGTPCSGDTGLVGTTHGTGSISVNAYTGTVALYKKGFLKIVPPPSQPRYLVYDNGEPFVWMGDTAWTAPIVASDSDWQSYVNGRSGLFSVIQVSPAPIEGGSAPCQPTDFHGNAPFVGSCAPISPSTTPNNLPNHDSYWNPAYWQDLEKKVQAANDANLVVGLIGVMEPLDEFPHTTMYPMTYSAKVFARNLVARFAGNFVFYSPSNDSPVSDSTIRQMMIDVGNEIHYYTSQMLRPQLVTNHPAAEVTNTTQQQLHSQPWLDFDMIQSGQNPSYLSADLDRAADQANALYVMTTPMIKPVVNGEGIYDDTSSSTFQNAYRTREVAYLSTLSGAFGYTYGVDEISNWTPGSLTAAEGLTSSGQMKILRTMLNNHDWTNLTPVLTGSSATAGTARTAFAKTGMTAMAYVPDGASEVVLNLTSLGCFPAAWTRRWMSPRTNMCAKLSGKCITPTITGPATAYHFAKPAPGYCDGPVCDGNDWVLSLMRTGRCSSVDLGGGLQSLAGSLADDTSSPTGDIGMTPLDSDFIGSPVVASQSDGSSMVVWEKQGVDGAGNEIHARVFDPTGTPIAADFIISGADEGSQSHPYVAVNDLGSYAVVWARRDTDGNPQGIWAEVFDASGTSEAPEFQVNCSQNDADYPQIAIPSSYYVSGYGYMMVVWVSNDSGGSQTLRAQDFYGTGTLSGSSWIAGTPDPTVFSLDSLASESSWTTTYECSF